MEACERLDGGGGVVRATVELSPACFYLFFLDKDPTLNNVPYILKEALSQRR
jgi:hypothetical protein